MNKLTKTRSKYNKDKPFHMYKGMVTLVMGATAARVIGFISIPFATRLYSPTDFGILALFASFVAILVPFATLKYATAIPLPKSDALAINILTLGLILTASLSMITGGAFYFFGDVIFSLFDVEDLAQWWWLIVLTVAGTASFELFSMWSTRKRKYKILAKTEFSQSLIGNVTKITFGLLGSSPFGLIFGQFIAQSSGVVSLLISSKQDIVNNYPLISLRRIKFVASYFKHFPCFRLPSQILLILSTQAPILMMASLFTKDITGQLSLALMAIALPASLVGGAIAKVFYAEIAIVGKKDMMKIKSLAKVVQGKLFVFGIPLTIVLMVLAEPLFKLLFGQEWELAGEYAAILAPFVFLQLTSAPLVQVLNITGSQLAYLMINLLRIIGLAIIFISFREYQYSSDLLVKALSVFLSGFYVLVGGFVFYTINVKAENRKC